MRSDASPAVVVVAGVIERDGTWLVTRRLEGTHLAGLWEFPGGKCEPGEPLAACLQRELKEELGVDATIGAELIVTEHVYADRTVRLHFLRAEIDGTPRAILGQQMQWVGRDELARLPLPPADRALVELLTSPSRRPGSSSRRP